MRAHLSLVLLLVLVALAVPAEALASSPASARAVQCRPAGTNGYPSADFEGRMHAVGGTVRMAMRFEVQEKVGSGPWRSVSAPALRRSRHSSRGVKSFSFVQRVENLTLEGSYRVVVHFRWMGRGGEVIRTADKSSDPCRAVEPVVGG